MHLAAIRAANGRFLERTPDGGIAAVGTSPDARRGVIVQYLNRDATSPVDNDSLLIIRDVPTNNVWRLGYWQFPVGSGEPIPLPERASRIPNDGTLFLDTPTRYPEVLGLHIMAQAWIPDEIGFVQAFLVTHVPAATDPLLGAPVKLAVVVPSHDVYFSALPPLFGRFLESRANVIQSDLGRDPSIPVGPFILGYLSIDPSGLLIAAHAPRTDANDTFHILPHSLRVRLRAPNRRYVTVGASGQWLASGTSPAESPPLTLFIAERSFSQDLRHGDVVTIGAPDGSRAAAGRDNRLVSGGSDRMPQVFRIERALGEGRVEDQESVRFVPQPVPGRDASGRWVVSARDPVSGQDVISVAGTAPPPDHDLFTVETMEDLTLFRTPGGFDSASATIPPRGYSAVRRQCRLFLGPRPATVPVRIFRRRSPRGLVHLTTATEFGHERARIRRYTFVRFEGFAWADSQIGTVPLKLYLSSTDDRAFLTATQADEREAGPLAFASIEGYVPEIVERAPTLPSSALPGILRPGGIAPGVILPPIIVGPRPTRPVRALVLSGGGAKGAFEAGAVQTLARTFEPDLIVGVSAGAINAAKLAEGGAAAADELVELWLRNGRTPNAIFRRNFYPRLFSRLMKRLEDELRGSPIDVLVGYLIGGFVGLLGGPLGGVALGVAGGHAVGAPALGALLGMFVPGPATGGLVGTGIAGSILLKDQSPRAIRLLNATLTLLHCLHSMQPLRSILGSDALDLEALRSSGVDLRVGITDIKSGQFFTVSGPRWSNGPLADFGLLEVEPDHALGDTFLSRPLFGNQSYAMAVKDAVYASTVLPSYMEPLQIDLGLATSVADPSGRRFTALPTLPGGRMPLPTGLQRLIDLTSTPESADDSAVERWEAVIDEILADDTFEVAGQVGTVLGARLDAQGVRGKESAVRYFFDGGLRDTLPIRTALRLGATEIIVITGDRLHQFRHGYAVTRQIQATVADIILNGAGLNEVDFFAVPLFQHVKGLLGIWFNEASRTDVLLSVAHNEFVAWVRRAADRLSPAERARLLDEFRQYWVEEGVALTSAVGATSWLGGSPGQFPYGTPFDRQGARISFIAPDRDIVGPLDFDNGPAIQSAIELGRVAALTPLRISGEER